MKSMKIFGIADLLTIKVLSWRESEPFIVLPISDVWNNAWSIDAIPVRCGITNAGGVGERRNTLFNPCFALRSVSGKKTWSSAATPWLCWERNKWTRTNLPTVATDSFIVNECKVTLLNSDVICYIPGTWYYYGTNYDTKMLPTLDAVAFIQENTVIIRSRCTVNFQMKLWRRARGGLSVKWKTSFETLQTWFLLMTWANQQKAAR